MVKKKTEFQQMQQDITVVKTKLEEHCNTQKEDFDRIYGSLEKLNTKFDNLNEQFAGKWIEKVVLGSLITLMGAIISAILYIISRGGV